jgi:hypothetical protein
MLLVFLGGWSCLPASESTAIKARTLTVMALVAYGVVLAHDIYADTRSSRSYQQIAVLQCKHASPLTSQTLTKALLILTAFPLPTSTFTTAH